MRKSERSTRSLKTFALLRLLQGYTKSTAQLVFSCVERKGVRHEPKA